MRLRLMLLFACFCTVFSTGHAQGAYPDRPIRMIDPFAAGGPSDLVARIVAQGMGKRLGQSVIVENKAGAGGLMGTNLVARAAPDGYTILLATIAYTISPFMYKSVPYDPKTYLAPLGLIARAPLVLVVRPTLKVDSVASLIKLMQASPGKYSFGSSGIGSVDHLAGVLFESSAHVQGVHVPYRGAEPAIQDLLAGRVDFMITTNFPLMPYIKNGALKALAVTSSDRLPQLPEVPTMAQAGLPGVDVSVWYSLMAPRGVPADIVDKLNKAMVRTLAQPDAQKRFKALGTTIAPDDSPAQLGKFIEAEQGRWSRMIQAAGVKKP